MNVPDTFPETCHRAAELASQGRYSEAFELHRRYRIKAADRGDKHWTLPPEEVIRRKEQNRIIFPT